MRKSAADERTRLAFILMSQQSYTVEGAGLVAFATFPYDDGIPRNRKFTKAITKCQRASFKRVRAANGERAATVAIAQERLAEYLQIATVHNHEYYVDRFQRLLSGETTTRRDD